MTEMYFASAIERGFDYQDFVAEQLYRVGIVLVNFQGRPAQGDRGENLLGLEIKFDDVFATTGKLWIEVEEKRNASQTLWARSGIYRDDPSWLYGIGNRREFFIFGKRQLQRECGSGTWIIRENKTATSRGFLLPRSRAIELAEKMIAFDLIT